MVRNVFRLDDRQLGSLMVPRRDVVALDAKLPWQENAKRIEQAHTRYPVVRGGMREIIGVISAPASWALRCTDGRLTSNATRSRRCTCRKA